MGVPRDTMAKVMGTPVPWHRGDDPFFLGKRLLTHGHSHCFNGESNRLDVIGRNFHAV